MAQKLSTLTGSFSTQDSSSNDEMKRMNKYDLHCHISLNVTHTHTHIHRYVFLASLPVVLVYWGAYFLLIKRQKLEPTPEEEVEEEEEKVLVQASGIINNVNSNNKEEEEEEINAEPHCYRCLDCLRSSCQRVLRCVRLVLRLSLNVSGPQNPHSADHCLTVYTYTLYSCLLCTCLSMRRKASVLKPGQR